MNEHNQMYKLFLTLFIITSHVASYGQAPDNLTFGLVQQAVAKGVSKEKILESLGSPNMVTTNSEQNETWIYDKVSSTVENKTDSSATSVGGGALGGVLGIFGAWGKSEGSKKEVTSQRTLTLIIKFKGDLVDSYSSRSTSF
jgi:outer membrane protein assembly factor BamE (lipoprotein component of BamABCDE complex)